MTKAPAKQSLSPLAVAAAMCGNLMEWYDFALYGVLAATLGEVFFPSGSRLVALLAVFGVFAAGYFMRLVGGGAFGHIADRLGRRRALLLSAATMAGATALVGCLPSYTQVGVLAPVLFTLFRLLQGLSIGGEFTTSISYLIEHAPPGRRALHGSLAGCAGGVGVLLGSAMGTALFSVFTTDEVRTWAWRLPFLLALPLGLSLAVLRVGLPEDTPRDAAERSPVSTVLRERPAEIVRGALLGWGANTSFYTIAVFLGSFLTVERLLPEHTALSIQTASIASMVILTPLAGALADRLGRKPLVLTSLIGCAVLAWPLLAILRNGNASDDWFAELIFAAFIVGGMAPYQVWLAERFPRGLRASGLGLAYNGAAGILGGTTPLLSTSLADATGSPLAPAAYVTIACLISLAVAMRTPETGRTPLT
jgi:MHS family proline/betaine transporter-like MFS transporter